ncbi:serine/arginine repetitive matrix protein 1 [Drosophila rhopaloa]|uniref:Serine/arginine repetitive matrix protein 1 n=1 Tax=Drosophila rhopaloa TaxID=1041015 RepID=A0A6P4F2H2_DRORH|nr:serine/arginine repetitive matrix protein 1 [Drosophila rhopaloa]
MQQNIWNSPQVGGSGGALKALARNVANHLKLNRSSMKRVVAQVVAEHHTLGEVADYKGHMYFAKPDRLNFNELIAQSKEAFDDLLLHEPRSSRKRTTKSRSRNPTSSKIHLQKKVSPPQLAAPAKKSLIAKKPAPPMQRNKRRRKSSTTIFQLADAGRRSLNGVIIDDTHLPHDGERREILLHVPSALVKRSRRRLRASQTKVSSEKGQVQKPGKDQAQKVEAKKNKSQKELIQGKTQKMHIPEKRLQKYRKTMKQPQTVKNPQEQKQEKPLEEPLRSPSRSPTRSRSRSPTHRSRSPTQRSRSPTQRSRSPTHRSRSPTHQSRSPTHRSRSPLASPTSRSPSPSRTLVANQKYSSAHKLDTPLRSRESQKQIVAFGSVFYQRIKAGDAQNQTSKLPKTKFRSKLRPHKKKLPLLLRTYEKPWLIRRTKRRLAGGSHKNKRIGAVKPQRLDNIDVKWEETVDKKEKTEQSARSSKEEVKKKSLANIRTQKRSTHVGRQMRNVNFPWYTPYQFQGGAGATQTPNAAVAIPPYRLLKAKTNQLQQRLMAIQPPKPSVVPQMRRGQNFTSRQRHNRRMQERLMRDLQREEAIDEPWSNGSGVFRRCRGGWSPPEKARTPEKPMKPEQQKKEQQQDHRSVERVSSRIKRLSNDRRCRQPIATSERIVIPPPKASHPNASPRNGRVRRRFRSVPVDSSLGSIALMGQPQSQTQSQANNKQTLTPAKRHLSIAFMNKRSERTNPAIQPWK